jgi:hypothetical protein
MVGSVRKAQSEHPGLSASQTRESPAEAGDLHPWRKECASIHQSTARQEDLRSWRVGLLSGKRLGARPGSTPPDECSPYGYQQAGQNEPGQDLSAGARKN